MNNTPPDLLPRFRETPGVAVTVRPGSTYAYLAFNLRDPVLGKVEVRRALALALDRDALAASFPDPGNGRPRLSLTCKTSTDET